MSLKTKLRRLIPSQILVAYHWTKAFFWSLRYGFPSRKMLIIGITGTKGKTTSANFLWSVLQTAGWQCGLIGTANIRIGEKEELNRYHMTMPGPKVIQALFAQMVKAGCQVCVMEATSEGLKLWRHLGIYFDIGIFTNLTPEHLPSHENNFEKYKLAKARLFESLAKGQPKLVGNRLIHPAAIINFDDIHGHFYLGYPVTRKITYGLNPAADYSARDILNTDHGLSFNVGHEHYILNILGNFNVYNTLPAIACAEYLGIPRRDIRTGLARLSVIPGRMEKIEAGQDFTLLVDYAHEKQSITGILKTAKEIVSGTKGRIIILLGAEGGGRDPRKRPIMGELAAKMADYLIVSNVDPYEDDPAEIAEDIARAARENGMRPDDNLLVILDRRAGINKALGLAEKGDVVLITGKGAEQSIIIDGKSLPWDDRVVVREELAKILQKD